MLTDALSIPHTFRSETANLVLVSKLTFIYLVENDLLLNFFNMYFLRNNNNDDKDDDIVLSLRVIPK